MSDVDFIEVYDAALSNEDCVAIVQRLRQSSQLQPGRVGGGVHPELKRSRDLRISGNDAWRDVEQRLQQAVFNGVLSYLRRYPQVLISPLMLQREGDDGQPRRLAAKDFPAMDDPALAELAHTCLRPGAINLQWYTAGEGGIRIGALRTVPA